RLLVGDDVRRQDAIAGREPDQSLSRQLADVARAEEERGRLTHLLHPEELARGGQGVQLATRAQWPRLSGHAPVLAEDRAAVHPAARQRDVAAAGHRGREVEEEKPMMRNTLPRVALVLGLLTTFVHAPRPAQAQGKLSEEEAQKIGVEA